MYKNFLKHVFELYLRHAVSRHIMIIVVRLNPMLLRGMDIIEKS